MDLIYRVLGIVAKTTQRISRIRGNGIPVNWLLLLLMGIFVAISIGAIREGRQNATGPRACTVSDIATHRIEPGAYVLVTGKPVLDMALADSDEKNPDTIWLPYVDGNPLHAIYVEVSKGKSKGAFHNGQCTGMVRPMPKELQRTVTVDGGRVGTAALDTANMLVVGETPDPQWIGFAAAGTLSLVMLAMLVVMLKRYTIFRPISLAPWEQIAAPQNFAAPVGLVRASGRFQFNDKIRRRFIEVSAVLAEMESGDFSLLANVDASEKLYGQVTKNLAGVWAILMRRGSCSDWQQGSLYFGRKRRPAIRFRCADAITGQPTTVIVTADETATLNHFRNQVEAAPNAAERGITCLDDALIAFSGTTASDRRDPRGWRSWGAKRRSFCNDNGPRICRAFPCAAKGDPRRFDRFASRSIDYARRRRVRRVSIPAAPNMRSTALVGSGTAAA